MIYNTAGNIIYEPIQGCDCGLTGGCEKCNPKLFEIKEKRESFIGSITDKEAEEWKDQIKKRKYQGFCLNCRKPLEPFCSRYCKIDYEADKEWRMKQLKP